MTTSLIRFDDKHISTAQVITADDCVLEEFIHNLSKSLGTEIRGYLQDTEFLHASHMLRGCKLDPTLIDMLVKRWRLKTHTYHLLCGECTITLKDVALKLSLSMDDSIVTGSTIVLNKEDLCEVFLGKVSNKFYSDQINMKWLETNFKDLPKDAPNVIKEQYALTFILRLIEGILMLINLKIWYT
ncbi:hypothetical protein J1N35_017615 [Gossypium stocksii]|uniref:Aminotransferase-like plant mobile domain-containing protein n=1 Tax=Gossypium stocksii TaxID=47602 RepID=A0A9D3VPB8_9ROSI|nr:hypothetical protein J1N35_017615 [Gossypium stocksii]